MTDTFDPPPEITPAGPRRQQRGIRFPQLLLSLLIVAVFALLAVWWQANTTAREPALALAVDVSGGQPLQASDLTQIYISADVQPRVFAPEFSSSFVGAIPITDLRSGTLLTDSMFRTANPLGKDEAIVGFTVSRQQAHARLEAGDLVQVLTEGPDDGRLMLAPKARVEAVFALSAADRPSRSEQLAATERLVQLRLPVGNAQIVQLLASEVVLIEIADPADVADGEDETPNSESEGADS